MSSKELYYMFSVLANKNHEDSNINLEKGNFVLLFNREAERWLAEKIETNNTSDDIFELQSLLILDEKLEKLDNEENKVEYSIPLNFNTLITGKNYSDVKQGECKGKIFNYFVKPNDLNVALEDQFKRPDFNWERGLATLSSNVLTVYKKGFEVKDTYLSYYKSPLKIDIEGYKNLDGNPSVNVDSDLPKVAQEEILDRVVTEVNREFNNAPDLQIALERQTH